MQDQVLPVGLQADIDDVFCFREDCSYQERAHGYLERYEVCRGYRDTAVQAVVTDMARRAFRAGAEGREDAPTEEDLGAIRAELLEAAAKCTRAALSIGGGASVTRLYISGPVTGGAMTTMCGPGGVAYSSQRHDWETPQDFFDALDAEFGFDLDAAAGAVNAKRPDYYDEAGDGLEMLMGDIKDYGAEVHIDECRAAATDEWTRRLARLIERNGG